MSLFWFILFIMLLLIEIVTVNLVSIWFALGSISALIATFFTDSLFIQVLVFVLVSIVTLLVTKPLIKKFRKVEVIPTNLDRVIGKKGVVIKKISPDEFGEVKVLGTVWTAVSDSDIEVGSNVLVEKIDGVKLIVFEEENYRNFYWF